MNLSKENVRKIIVIVCSVILFYCALQNLGAVISGIQYFIGLLFPFILGGAIAFILNVPMKQIEKKLFRKNMNAKVIQLRRPFAYGITLIIVIGIIVLAFFVVVPELALTLAGIVKEMPQAFDNSLTFMKALTVKYPQLQVVLDGINIDGQEVMQNVGAYIQTIALGMISSSIGIISGVISGVATFFIGFVFSIYILFQKEKLLSQCKQIIVALFSDKACNKIIHIAIVTEQAFSNFLTGQCLEAVILGTIFFVTMTVFKLPYALLIGILIAITALIPIVGAFIGCIVGAILIVTVNPMQAVLFVVMFLILQQIEGNLIYPRVVGSSVGLPSIWVLAAVTIGGKLMGVLGILVFIPLCSIAYSLFREFIKKKLITKGIN